MASAADSCMTPPSCPVSLTWPSDLEVDILLASTTIVSPPTLVQASPTATPATPRRPASSDSNLGCPRTSSISFKSIIYRLNLTSRFFSSVHMKQESFIYLFLKESLDYLFLALMESLFCVFLALHIWKVWYICS